MTHRDRIFILAQDLPDSSNDTLTEKVGYIGSDSGNSKPADFENVSDLSENEDELSSGNFLKKKEADSLLERNRPVQIGIDFDSFNISKQFFYTRQRYFQSF